MAHKHPSKANVVIVDSGDTLWAIASNWLGDPNKYKQLAAINNIKNPNLIYVGQEIALVASSSGSSSSASSSSSSNAPTITAFGLQADTDRTLFAIWSWSKSDTEKYQVKWEYYAKNWFIGSSSGVSVDENDPDASKQSTYTIPDNATQVRFSVKPVAKKKRVNDADVAPWTADWSTVRTYDVSDLPVPIPAVPTVTIEDSTLTATLENIDDTTDAIQFEIIKDNLSVFKYVDAKVNTTYAACSVTVTIGAEYKVRVRGCKDGVYGEWSEYSANVSTAPSAPTRITEGRATSETSIFLRWESVSTADAYEIEYTTERYKFDDNFASSDVTSRSGIETPYYELTGLESGHEYFFRVRATNTQGESGWSAIFSSTLGKAPAAPTTWSSTTKVITGEPLNLYWVHNSEDGSSQTYAELELIVNGVKTTHTIKNSTAEEEKDKTSVYSVPTSGYVEGVVIQWRVRTRGVPTTYSEWSMLRTVDVYSPPVLELTVTDGNGSAFSTLTAFPFTVVGTTYPSTQRPVGYHLSIIANEPYDTIDYLGNETRVNRGDEVYSRHFDISSRLSVTISASDVNLDNNVQYTLKCVASLSSGLTATNSRIFTVGWVDAECQPNAEISIDPETLVAYIRPYSATEVVTYRKVELDGRQYINTNVIVDGVFGSPIRGAITTTGEMVYSGIDSAGQPIFYCEVKEITSQDDALLSVYRREFDGSFTEIATNLPNGRNTFVTDPHPALDYARYRIVALDNSTGSVSFCDIPGIPVGEKAAIIQWDEAWSSFDVVDDAVLSEPAWAGSMLKLLYNIDVSEDHDNDVELVQYIGRKHPVTYYGTQLGETYNWNVEIPKTDKDTLYALRRLSVWMGDVYVREPSGTGYWANVSVSISQTHCELTIPVTLKLTRVMGGA